VNHGVFVGLSTIDVIYSLKSFPEPNSKVTAKSQNVFVGGPATNAAITFAHLGGQATLVTALGRHPLASLVRGELRKYSVRLTDLHPAFDEVPVISSIFVNSAGERNVVSANAVRMGEIPVSVDDAICEEAAVLLVDGHYMQACQFWARTAQARGKQVVFDGGSWKPGTEELLGMVDTVICSADFRPPGCSSPKDVLEYVRSQGVTRIAVSQGAAPIQFLNEGFQGSVEVPQVELVDTTGAGDILHGAFCYYTAGGHGFVESLRAAAVAASESCRFRGTRGWMQDAGEKLSAD
jgi:sugar/nucleoside kinase (ribokinase family)